MRTLMHLLWWVWTWPFVAAFGGSSGPPPSVVNVAPPASLFPGITSALHQQGPGAVDTATSSMKDIAGGVDVSKMYEAVKAAAQRQGQEGQASLMSSMGASGMASSSDAMRSVADYQLQFQSNLLSQLQQMQFQNEGLKLAGSQALMETYANAGMAFAPTQEVVGNSAGPSTFSQVAGAATGSAALLAMLLLACWVAAELYGGWLSPEVFTLRYYLGTRKSKVGKGFAFLYVRFGQRVAAHIKLHPLSRKVVKLLFDWLLSRAFYWRLSCRSQA